MHIRHCQTTTKTLLRVASIVCVLDPVWADEFGAGAEKFTINFVNIGNPGNVADDTSYGAVNYSYQMGTYEVSRDMISKANISGNLAIPLADMTRFSSGNSATMPATGMSWVQAAKFVNYLNTSTGHAPAYNFDDRGRFNLWAAADAWNLGGENLYRNKNAHYFLPSENEWYKAAYFDGTRYYRYPTGSDTPPGAVVGGTDLRTAVYELSEENFLQCPADITNAGGLSPYGTMAQGGNVGEWLESAFDGINNSNLSLEHRVFRGGYWSNESELLSSAYRHDSIPTTYGEGAGFRIAAIPESSKSTATLGALLLCVAVVRKRMLNKRPVRRVCG